MSEPDVGVYFLENRERGRVGNCILWYAQDGQGYTCHLDRAHKFTAEDLEGMDLDRKYRAWPALHVISVATMQVDFQRLNSDFSVPPPTQ